MTSVALLSWVSATSPHQDLSHWHWSTFKCPHLQNTHTHTYVHTHTHTKHINPHLSPVLTLSPLSFSVTSTPPTYPTVNHSIWPMTPLQLSLVSPKTSMLFNPTRRVFSPTWALSIVQYWDLLFLYLFLRVLGKQWPLPLFLPFQSNSSPFGQASECWSLRSWV